MKDQLEEQKKELKLECVNEKVYDDSIQRIQDACNKKVAAAEFTAAKAANQTKNQHGRFQMAMDKKTDMVEKVKDVAQKTLSEANRKHSRETQRNESSIYLAKRRHTKHMIARDSVLDCINKEKKGIEDHCSTVFDRKSFDVCNVVQAALQLEKDRHSKQIHALKVKVKEMS